MPVPPDDALILAADLGGTRLAVGLVEQQGSVLASRSVAADRLGPERVIENLTLALADMRAEGAARGRTVAGVGLGVPGVVDGEGCIGEDIQNLPALAGAPLRQQVQAATGLATVVDNDVNALLLGEWRFGQARGLRDVAMIAAGTGVGGALILNGALVRGILGYAGEIGHVTVDLDGRPCCCGSRGCVKAYAAGPDIAAHARERYGREASPILAALCGGDAARIDCPVVLVAAAQGDPLATAVLDRAAQALGAAIAALINLCNPAMVIVGGGVAAGAPRIVSEASRWAGVYAFDAAVRGTRIVGSGLSKESGILGAAALFLLAAEREAKQHGARQVV